MSTTGSKRRWSGASGAIFLVETTTIVVAPCARWVRGAGIGHRDRTAAVCRLTMSCRSGGIVNQKFVGDPSLCRNRDSPCTAQCRLVLSLSNSLLRVVLICKAGCPSLMPDHEQPQCRGVHRMTTSTPTAVVPDRQRVRAPNTNTTGRNCPLCASGAQGDCGRVCVGGARRLRAFMPQARVPRAGWGGTR